jgi:NitT/TauT family transport system substrate-binding protein
MHTLKYLLVAAALVAAAPSNAAEKIKVSVSVLSGAFAMYFVAIDRGYFEREGLEVEVIQAAGPPATAALISGDLAFNASPGAALSAILKNAPLKIMMVSNDQPPYQLWSGDDKIKKLEDLKGQRVGVISHGDTHEMALRLLFASQGIDPKSVIYAPIGPGAGRVASITANSVPAASLTVDEVEQVRSNPKLHMVFDTSKAVKLINGGLATSDRMLGPERAMAKRFTRALVQGRRFASAFEKEAVDSVHKRVPMSAREALVTSFRISQAGATKDGTLTREIQQAELDVRGELLGISKDKLPPLDKVFDFSLVEEVNRELDAQGWKPSL